MNRTCPYWWWVVFVDHLITNCIDCTDEDECRDFLKRMKEAKL